MWNVFQWFLIISNRKGCGTNKLEPFYLKWFMPRFAEIGQVVKIGKGYRQTNRQTEARQKSDQKSFKK